MLKLRVITVAFLLPVFVTGAYWLPGNWWRATMFGITLLAACEWSRLAGFSRAVTVLFYCAVALCSAACVVAETADYWVFGISIAFWMVLAPLALWRKQALRDKSTLAATGIVVLVPMWLALVRLQLQPGMMLALLAVVWISDSAAYGAGRAIGRHKLAPTISPGKTWEGVGGAFAAVAVYAFIFHFWWFPATDLGFVLASFFAISTFGILGDLLESMMKRNAGVKDSGTLLPGHGGVLDRVDALTAAMPLAALLFSQP